MRTILLTAVFGLLTAGAAAAEKTDFTAAAFAKQLSAVTAAPAATAPEVQKPARAKAGRYVQVSGYVNLTGNGFVPGPNGGYASVPLSGWASFRDSSGQVTSGNSYINVYASMWIYPNQYVFQTVWPNVYAQFTYKGKPAGSASMSGSVQVSGWPSGNFVSLNGSGYLNGSVYVEDAE